MKASMISTEVQPHAGRQRKGEEPWFQPALRSQPRERCDFTPPDKHAWEYPGGWKTIRLLSEPAEMRRGVDGARGPEQDLAKNRLYGIAGSTARSRVDGRRLRYTRRSGGAAAAFLARCR